MTSIATNANNDIYLDATGNLAMVSGINAVQQDCEHAMKTQVGECILQTTYGVPTMETVWLEWKPKQFEAAARALLLTVPDVIQVTSFTITRSGNVANYTADIESTYGPLAIQGTLTQ